MTFAVKKPDDTESEHLLRKQSPVTPPQCPLSSLAGVLRGVCRRCHVSFLLLPLQCRRHHHGHITAPTDTHFAPSAAPQQQTDPASSAITPQARVGVGFCCCCCCQSLFCSETLLPNVSEAAAIGQCGLPSH